MPALFRSARTLPATGGSRPAPGERCWLLARAVEGTITTRSDRGTPTAVPGYRPLLPDPATLRRALATPVHPQATVRTPCSADRTFPDFTTTSRDGRRALHRPE